jgi:hypothetical protein
VSGRSVQFVSVVVAAEALDHIFRIVLELEAGLPGFCWVGFSCSSGRNLGPRKVKKIMTMNW